MELSTAAAAKSPPASVKPEQQQMLRRVLATMVIFSIGMITLPLTSYFVFRHLSHGSTVIGASAAIVMVHIILAAFVYKALTESDGDEPAILQKPKLL